MTLSSKTLTAAGLFLSLLASVAAAQELNVDASLRSMAQAEGAAYVRARDALLAQPGAAEALEAHLAQANWRSVEDALAASALARLRQPKLVQRVNALEGVDAAVYMQRRRPMPTVMRELRNLGPEAAPGMLELVLKTRGSYAYTNAFSRKLSTAEIERLQREQEVALAGGLLMVLGHSKHPAASFVLRRELLDASKGVAYRSAAAAGLGETGETAALTSLSAVARDREQAGELRGACLHAAAQLRGEAALELLVELSEGERPLQLRQSAVAGLGSFGSAWAWKALGQEQMGEALRRRAAIHLVKVLAAQPELGSYVVQSIASVGHASAVELLNQLTEDAEDAPVRDLAAEAKSLLELALSRRR
jgi:hypothetical protein